MLEPHIFCAVLACACWLPSFVLRTKAQILRLRVCTTMLASKGTNANASPKKYFVIIFTLSIAFRSRVAYIGINKTLWF